MMLMTLVKNPGRISKNSLAKVHYCYRQPLQNSHIVIENEMLIYCKPIQGSTSYCRLQIVPFDLRNILFIAFHTNPIGGHFNAYKTIHRLCLCYYWPEMFSYICCMCSACPGCTLANPTHNKSSELVYHFPLNAPFWVLFVDGYSAGRQSSFKGDKTYLIVCYGMTGFAGMEPVKHATSAPFASPLMKIQLRFGLCHSIVLNKDTKFFSMFKEACDCLQLNRHVLLGSNHNPMMVGGALIKTTAI
jgi:hypothetical protein